MTNIASFDDIRAAHRRAKHFGSDHDEAITVVAVSFDLPEDTVRTLVEQVPALDTGPLADHPCAEAHFFGTAGQQGISA